MFALQDRVHDNAGNALAQPRNDAFPVRFEAGNGGDGAPGGRQPRAIVASSGAAKFAASQPRPLGQAAQAGRRAPASLRKE